MAAIAVSAVRPPRRPARMVETTAVYVAGAIAATLFAAPLLAVLLNSFKTPIEASMSPRHTSRTHGRLKITRR